MGYTLSPDFQHQGVATKALQETLSFLFAHLNKHRVTTSIDPSSASSIHLVND
jgi:RimJ/RimL family protein N-acetyltransferase